MNEDITFYFNISPLPDGVTNPISVTIPAGQTTADSSLITVPVDDGITYIITEVNIPAGWQLDSSSNTSIVIDSDGQSEVAVFNDSESPTETGCITIIKVLEGNLIVSGTFTFDIYDNPDGTGEPVATASINVTDNVPEGPAVVCGLPLGQTY